MFASSFVALAPGSRAASLFLLAFACILAGCGGGSSSSSSGGSQPTISTITVSPASPSIAVGATQQFTATAKDSSGNTISGVTFSWSSTNTSVATINSSGLATATLAGTTQITAAVGNVASAPDTLTVTPASSVSSIFTGVPGPMIFAGGNQETVTITVSNDQPSDVLSLTASSNGTPCTPALCGTFGAIAGTAGSGSYTLPYTPPASLTADT